MYAFFFLKRYNQIMNVSKEMMIELADKYETPEFIKADPSCFMHRYTGADAETVAFIAANLAFGRREQILSHVEQILNFMSEDKKTPVQWILEKQYEKRFRKDNKTSFYRMYSFCDLRIFFDTLNRILSEEMSLGKYFQKKWNGRKGECENLFLHQVIAECFPEECALISHSKNCAAKKLNMFLRWMVRQNSPVDLGLWTWYDQKNLLMPLDTHVMQQSVEFGFIKKTAAGKVPGANLKTALQLSQKMSEFFGNDPVRGDFALFGLGVNSKKTTD